VIEHLPSVTDGSRKEWKMTVFDLRGLTRLTGHLAGSPVALSPGLFLQAIRSSERLSNLEKQGKCASLLEMVAVHAWKDAALELLVLGAPHWTLARLCREDDLWMCILTSHAGLPDWLDDAIECQNENADAALMTAVLEALAKPSTPSQTFRLPLLTAADCDAYR